MFKIPNTKISQLEECWTWNVTVTKIFNGVPKYTPLFVHYFEAKMGRGIA